MCNWHDHWPGDHRRLRQAASAETAASAQVASGSAARPSGGAKGQSLVEGSDRRHVEHETNAEYETDAGHRNSDRPETRSTAASREKVDRHFRREKGQYLLF